jgi:peroxiredoxin Q/BCP
VDWERNATQAGLGHPKGPMIQEGQPAPPFTLKDAAGRPWSLEALRAGGPVVVFFYPRDESPICTREVCAFRDAHQDFAEAGAAVVGISSDDEAAHESFALKQRLNYVLLSDPGGKVREAYGVPRTLGVLDGRATFVIDRGGKVRMAYSAQLVAEGHTRRALETVRAIRGEPGIAPAR